jgi:hypothetical protein
MIENKDLVNNSALKELDQMYEMTLNTQNIISKNIEIALRELKFLNSGTPEYEQKTKELQTLNLQYEKSLNSCDNLMNLKKQIIEKNKLY